MFLDPRLVGIVKTCICSDEELLILEIVCKSEFLLVPMSS